MHVLLADADVKESIQLRVSDPEFFMPDKELKQRLTAADLPSHGYRKIVEKKTETNFETGRPEYQETWRFLKKMPCSEVAAADARLNELLPGVFGDEVDRKLKHEIKNRDIENLETCLAGVEFHFKEHLGCRLNRVRRQAAPTAPSCRGCEGCKIIIVVIKPNKPGEDKDPK